MPGTHGEIFIAAVTGQAAFYGLTAQSIEPLVEQGDVTLIGTRPFPRDVAAPRNRLEEQIRRDGFEQIIEAVAYTWFNRFAAIRYMETEWIPGSRLPRFEPS